MSIAQNNENHSYECPDLRAQLLVNIKQSFPEEYLLSTTNIPVGNPSTSSEYLVSQLFFQNRKWTEITFDELLSYPSGASAAITFLSDRAFCYYLPLFLFCIVDDYYKSDVMSESLISDMTPGLQTHRREAFDSRFVFLGVEQRRCVALFLKFLTQCYADDFPNADVDDISPAVALSRYWGEFLEQAT